MALNSVALFAGGVAAFYIGRYLASDFVQRRGGRRFKQILNGVKNEGWRFVAFVRLMPIFHHASVGYALGATRLRFREFAIPTAICLLPGSFAFTWLGHVGREGASGTEDFIIDAMLALGLIAVAAFIPRLMMRSRRRFGIEYEDLVEIHRAGEAMTVLVLGDDRVSLPPASEIDAETVAGGALGSWMESNRQRMQVPLVVAAGNESSALRAVQLMRKAGFVDVSYLFGGTRALREHATAAVAHATATGRETV